MGEEWRRGWHPEYIDPKGSDDRVLIVGAGPAGLEAARALGQRGYEVMLAEATRELGGRVSAECRLPGLAEWARVRDYRVGQLDKLPNVEIYRESELSLDDILEVGADHVAIATGAQWRRDGYGNHHTSPMAPPPPAEKTFTPDDIMAGKLPAGPTIVFDDDGYYMASVIAEKLRIQGLEVTYVTPDVRVSNWSIYTDEQPRVHVRLAEIGVKIILNSGLDSFDGREAVLSCSYTGAEQTITADNLVLVTCRIPKDSLYRELLDAMENNVEGAPKTVKRIGDADAPAIIAAAVYAGHKYARELDCDVNPDNPAKYDRVFFEESETLT
jgi:dimethylamine/trimethylamine dehydrogenase